MVCCFCLFLTPTSNADEGDQAELSGKAREILRVNCYRCHGQDGTIEGGMNYIIDLPKLVARKKIVPGDTRQSKLYKRLTSRTNPMPPEEEKVRPGPAEVEEIKKWIEAGAPVENISPKRKFISDAEVIQSIYADLQKLDVRAQPFTRYFTLTHLANAGFSEDELQTYRHGLSKLINSLSWETGITKPNAIDSAKTIFRIDLRDYRWSGRTWQRLLDAYPYGVLPRSPVFRDIVATTECELPYLRADWFVFAASRPPLYHDILQLPKTEVELEKLLKVDAAQDIRAERAARAGFNGSGVSRNNRLIERHETTFGAYWKSYDFAGNSGRQNLFAHPLGPGDRDYMFRHDGGEFIFHLPNGLQAYMLVDGHGRRLNEGPVQIVSVKSKPDPRVTNGVSCMFCHARGIIEKSDQVRAHVLRNPQSFSEADTQTILALYPEEKRFHHFQSQDAERFKKAVDAAGAKLGTTESVAALAERFDSELDLALAAAETGMAAKQFLLALERVPRLAQRLGALQAEGNTVQRQVFVDCFEELTGALQLGTSLTALNRDIVKWSNAIRRDSHNAQAYYDRGHAYAVKGDFDRALTDLNEAIRLEPQRASFFVERAWVHLSRKEYEASIANNTEALRLEPANADALFNRGGAHAALGNHQSAVADYSEVIRLEPKNAAAYVDRGRARARGGSAENAARDFASAYALDQRFFSNLKEGIQNLMQSGQADAAKQILSGLIEKRPDDLEIKQLHSKADMMREK
jgi:tetratricopeptide (TPR) repeat protein